MIDALASAASKESAFRAALSAWRSLRDPRLGAMVEHLGRQLRGAPLKGDLHKAWLARAAEAGPHDLEVLLEALGKQIDDGGGWWPIRPTEQRFARLLERMRALVELPDDPRTASALTALVRRAPFSPGWQGNLAAVYGPILALLARLRDPRSREALVGLHARPIHRVASIREYFTEALSQTLATMPVVAPVDDAVRARIDAIAERWGVPAEAPVDEGSEDELLAAIYADPDDDGLREVWADWLLERKDPRGEFVALQFALHRNTASAKDHKRLGSLLRRHQAEWLGELAIVTKNRVFRRGMLEQAELMSEGSAAEDLWQRVLVDERLSTVRRLEKGKANEGLYIRFLASPARRSLREAQAQSSNTVDALVTAKEPFRVEVLRMDRASPESLKAIARSTTLPALHTLEIDVGEKLDGMIERIGKSGVASRLRTILVNPGWHDLMPQGAFERLETLGVERYGMCRSDGSSIVATGHGDARRIRIDGLLRPEAIAHLPHAAELELTASELTQWSVDWLQGRGADILRAAQARADKVLIADGLKPYLGEVS